MKMSEIIFDRLIADAGAKGITINDPDKPRYIERLSNDDALLMAKADCNVLVVTRHIKLVKINYEEKVIFALFGISEPEQAPAGLAITDITPGTFAVSIFHTDTQPMPSVTPSEIREVIELRFYTEGGDYDGNEISEIADLFPKIYFLQVVELFDYHYDDYRVIGSLISRTYLDGPIQLDPATIEAMARVFETASNFIPYKNIVQGILSISWDGLFLELYRCIEQLYACNKLTPLTKKWVTNSSLRDIAALLETELAWRPKEDESLIGLIAECETQTIARAYSAMGGDQNFGDLINPSDTVGRLIYKLRNSIVHYRPAHEAVQKNEASWNEIVTAMLEIIEQSYERLGESFFSSVATVVVDEKASTVEGVSFPIVR